MAPRPVPLGGRGAGTNIEKGRMKNVTRVGARVRRRLGALQRQLAAARFAAGMAPETLAELLGVTLRGLRSWERCYKNPSTPHLIWWAYTFRLRLAITTPDAPAPAVVSRVSLGPGESLVDHEVRRLATFLKRLREARRISQTDLALMIGVSRSSLQRWEDGLQTPTMLFLIAWADRLGCRLDLVRDEGWEGVPVADPLAA